MNADELKKDYAVFEKKYNLPKFEVLNEEFEIEKIKRKSGILLKMIRKVMTEKIINSMNFIEMVLNPMNAPRIYLPYIKSMTSKDKEEVDKLYNALSDVVLNSLGLEIDYSEKNEADAIIEICRKWEESKPAFRKLVKGIQNPAAAATRERSYFG